ncbi:hypothetical protein LCGC14_1573370, partial [marine sediment metagenome]
LGFEHIVYHGSPGFDRTVFLSPDLFHGGNPPAQRIFRLFGLGGTRLMVRKHFDVLEDVGVCFQHVGRIVPRTAHVETRLDDGQGHFALLGIKGLLVDGLDTLPESTALVFMDGALRPRNPMQCALKALKLRNIDGQLRAEAFDIIEHPKIISQAEADRDQLVLNALDQFLARNNLSGSKVVIAAPGQSGFTRFVKLPPVETKQIPDIVRFEAEQQIPFDIDEVIWRWEDFKDPDSPDVEVGIFAMKRTDVGDVLDRFGEAGITVDVVQMAPLALYNFLQFDGQVAEDGATLLVDVGVDKTELVVADGPRIWTRTVQLGGSNFTTALVKAFKLSFPKAEKLKRTAATSKYARQIFQTMRPVFAELVQEISRSIGYYTSVHRESRFRRVVGLGNGFRLPGLQKFLEQNLNIPVVRLDSYNELPPSATVNAPAFTENVLSFAVAYGLALQGLGLTRIQTSLLPTEIARQRLWRRKYPWFAGAAALIISALSGMTWRAYADAGTLNTAQNVTLSGVNDMVGRYKKLREDHDLVKGRDKKEEDQIIEYDKMLRFRDFWPGVQAIISDAVTREARHQGLMNESDMKRLLQTPRGQRLTIEMDSLQRRYLDDVSGITAEKLRAMGGSGGRGRALGPMGRRGYSQMAPPMAGGGRGETADQTTSTETRRRGYIVTLSGRTSHQKAGPFLTRLVNRVLDGAGPYPGVEVTAGDVVSYQSGATAAKPTPGMMGIGIPRGLAGAGGIQTVPLDPLTGEDISGDTTFSIMWVFAIVEPDPQPTGDAAVGGGR